MPDKRIDYIMFNISGPASADQAQRSTGQFDSHVNTSPHSFVVPVIYTPGTNISETPTKTIDLTGILPE